MQLVKKNPCVCYVLYQTSAISPEFRLTAQLDTQISQADTLIDAKGAEGQSTQPPLLPGRVHITAQMQQRNNSKSSITSPRRNLGKKRVNKQNSLLNYNINLKNMQCLSWSFCSRPPQHLIVLPFVAIVGIAQTECLSASHPFHSNLTRGSVTR